MSATAKPAAAQSTRPEQCCALVPGLPNARRCTADGCQGWHYCEEHIRVAHDLIDLGLAVTEAEEQSPIRRHLDS